jgi:hypothetical protein
MTEAALATGHERRSGWGWFVLLWVIAAELIRNAVDTLLDRLPPSLREGHPWHDLVVLASWTTPLLVLVVAILLRRQPIADYFAWRRPRRVSDVVLGVLAVLAPVAVTLGLMIYFTGSAQFPVADYIGAHARGTSTWWYVLRWYPAFLYAPFVEETTYRGFLWRGLEDTWLRRPGTLIVTSFAFAAIHYRYYLQDGMFLPQEFLSPLLIGLILGWVRWRARSTVASMIAHSVSNIALQVGTVIAASR